MGRKKHAQIKKTLPGVVNKIISEPHELLMELVAEITEETCGYRPDYDVVKKYLVRRFQSNRQNIQKEKTQIIESVPDIKIIDKEIKIGQFVRTSLYQIFREGLVSDELIVQLQDKQYCKKEFNLNFPLFWKADTYTGKQPRYYKNPVVINGITYLVTSEWYEWNREPLKGWLIENGLGEWASILDI